MHRSSFLPFAFAAVAGCASAPPTVAPQTQVRLEPPARAVEGPLPALPPLSGSGTISEGNAPRVQDLTAVNQDVSTVVRALATRFGLQYQIEPGVKGVVNTTIRNATLPEALAMILPQGTTYQIANGVLRVAPARVETRIFSLDYVALSRVGTASTVIQRRLGSNAGIGGQGQTGGQGAVGGQGGFGGAGGLGGGADVISAVSIADVWEEIRVAVEALVFDEPAAGGATQASVSQAGVASMGGGGGRPYSRTSPDGRRLIINPIAGTITVSGMTGLLDQVDLFIKTFEASIQRQVLIEAKIVEVNLDRESEFGINWDIVAANAAGSFSPGGAGQSNITLTLRAGNTQINAVLTALQSQGNVQVLSSPRVSALNNQRAVFNVTRGEIVFSLTQQPIVNPNGTTTFTSTVNPTQVNVGIVLDVLPQISSDNTVTMNIRPVVTSVARTASFTVDGNTLQAPVIDTRESDTMARLRGGETIVIGGLMQNRRERVRSGVPVLMSIPLLGRLFSRTSDVERKAELVIFLTPTIIAGQPAPR